MHHDVHLGRRILVDLDGMDGPWRAADVLCGAVGSVSALDSGSGWNGAVISQEESLEDIAIEICQGCLLHLAGDCIPFR